MQNARHFIPGSVVSVYYEKNGLISKALIKVKIMATAECGRTHLDEYKYKIDFQNKKGATHMQEIKCPNCGEVFQVDETGYNQIARQP